MIHRESTEPTGYERPAVRDLGTLADLTLGGATTTADLTNDGSQ